MQTLLGDPYEESDNISNNNDDNESNKRKNIFSDLPYMWCTTEFEEIDTYTWENCGSWGY